MKGRPNCPHCRGRGVVLDPDPLVPARTCSCTLEGVADSAKLAIPARYREASFESFWEWWKIQHPRERIISGLESAQQLLEHEATRNTLSEELRSKLDHILHKCGAKGGDSSWKDLKPAQEPQGYRALLNWAKRDRDRVDLWWLDGRPGTGRSTLAAAALKACCAREGATGLFISVRTFSQELKDVYYDTRSFLNRDFMSERDRMEPLLKASCLVLDDLDRMDTDIRVVRAFAQLLDHRYAEELPTIITASRWAEVLQNSGPEGFSLTKLEDPNLMRRLAQSRRVVLSPILERLMDALNG
ncbi:MAG: ATP-binding protein [Holophaga sp.]|nr:ATP-binding protein [Holophaga sp.]